VGSGKGGVGKSVVAIVLAKALADLGRRVLLFEGDQNLATLHLVLGVRPTGRLASLIDGDEGSPTDLLTPVGERLWLLPGDSGAEALYALGPVERARLHHRLSALYDGFDAIVIDAAAGLESVVRVATMRATRLLVVTVPEPVALTDAYALIKIVSWQVPELGIDVLVNRTKNDAEGTTTFDRLRTAAERFLRRPLHYLGAVPEDDAVGAAMRGQPPLLLGAEAGPAVRALRSIAAHQLDLRPAGNDEPPPSVPE
jgi:flagellar biosynthesis protein FlhG